MVLSGEWSCDRACRARAVYILAAIRVTRFPSFLHPPKNLSDIQFSHPPAIPFTLPTLKEQTWQ
jgi:hypothetical protein